VSAMPSPVDKYVKKVRENNPDYTDAQAWATAWSIYCKHKNPGSEHCKKPADEYLKGKSATMDDIAIRVAAQSMVSSELASRVASRHVRALDLGKTFENESWRIHRFAHALHITDLTNAGKRGKKVEKLSLYEKSISRNIPWESIAMEFVMNAKRGANLAKMKQVADEQIEVFGSLVGLQIHIERGVDVMPGGFEPIIVDGEFVRIEAGYTDFLVKDKVDKNNEPTCIPAIKGGKKSIPAFYRWVQDNKSKLSGKKYYEVLRDMKDMGIEYHDYCAMD